VNTEFREKMKRFNGYYGKSITKLEDLYQKRGASFACSYDVNTNYFTEVYKLLEAYGEQSGKIGLLFYSVENDSLRTWFINKHSFIEKDIAFPTDSLVQLEFDIRRSLEVDRRSLDKAIISRGAVLGTPSKEAKPSLTKTIQKATNILLPKEFRIGLEKVEHLLIIPEFNIGQIPFHILQPFEQGVYLVDRLSYSFVPHLCQVSQFIDDEMNLGTPRSLSQKNPLVVGNPQFSQNLDLRLVPLPAAEQEAREISSLLGTTAIVGKLATVDTIIELSKKADLLYFATHGYFDFDKLLDGSFLAFAPSNSYPDGLWRARSIQNLRLKASLAILSACQTGYGKVYSGGFIGIGRAFFKAGVKDVILSLWSVDDEKTKELMIEFIKQLQQPSLYFPAGALQKAILSSKAKNPNPIYWAPFASFGFTY